MARNSEKTTKPNQVSRTHKHGTIPRTHAAAKRLGFEESNVGYNDLPASLKATFVQFSDQGSRSGSICGTMILDENTTLVCYKNSIGVCTWIKAPRAPPPEFHD
jgi:hypothetical protein